jgi:hypothetical protein
MKFSAYDELKLLLVDYTPQEIYDAASRLIDFEAAKNHMDMVAFSRRLCRMDEDNWVENR